MNLRLYPIIDTVETTLCAENYNKKGEKRALTYALTGFSCAIFHIKKNPRASITVRTLSA
jgi:hypothetical protein